MKKPARTLVLVNPAAGRGRARRAGPQVAAYLAGQGCAAEVVVARSIEEFRSQAGAAVRAGYASIAALGGDGSFQQLVRATLGAEVVLGVIPAGGGNDVAAALGIPDDPIAAAHAFLHSRPRAVDLIRAHFENGVTAHYVGGGGLGLDAEAARLASGRFRKLPGALRYVAAALAAFASFRPPAVEAEIDGQSVTPPRQALLLAAVVNTPTYGAGIHITPEAKIDDGLLDVALVEPLAWTRLLEVFPMLLRTGDVRWPEIRRFRGRHVRLRADRRAAFHGDGELLGEAPVELEILPGAIRVAAPQP